MDYKVMWERLKKDLSYFREGDLVGQSGLPGLDIWLLAMNFIEGIEKADEVEPPEGGENATIG